MGIKINFGALIKELIKKQSGTIEEEANRLGYSLAGMNKIFEKMDVNTAVLKKVCETYHIGMEYFLQQNTYVSQMGRNNVIGEGNNAFSGSHNVVGAKEITNEVILLKSENDGLKREMALLKDMVEILKAAKGIQTRREPSSDDDLSK